MLDIFAIFKTLIMNQCGMEQPLELTFYHGINGRWCQNISVTGIYYGDLNDKLYYNFQRKFPVC